MAIYCEDDRHEYDLLYNEIQALKERNKELVADLMRKSAEASEAQEKLKQWRTELETLADQKGHNLCWVGIPKLLKNTIGYTGKYPDAEGVTREEFESGCAVYIKDLFLGREEDGNV
jgi:hypothetical protein